MEDDKSALPPPVTEVIDPRVMWAVVGNDPGMVRELATEFLPDARLGIGEIAQAIDDRSAERVSAASHKLKGSCALVGARHLIAICADLEIAAKACDWSVIGNRAGQLDRRMKEVEEAINGFLAETAEH